VGERVARVENRDVSAEEKKAFDKTHLDDCREYLTKLIHDKLSMSHLTVGELRSRYEWVVQYAYKLYWENDVLREKLAEAKREKA